MSHNCWVIISTRMLKWCLRNTWAGSWRLRRILVFFLAIIYFNLFVFNRTEGVRGNILSNRKTSVYIQQVKRVTAQNFFHQGFVDTNIWILSYIQMSFVFIGWCPSYNHNHTRDDDDGVSTQAETFRVTNWPRNPHQRNSHKSQSCTPLDFDSNNTQVTFRANN